MVSIPRRICTFRSVEAWVILKQCLKSVVAVAADRVLAFEKLCKPASSGHTTEREKIGVTCLKGDSRTFHPRKL